MQNTYLKIDLIMFLIMLKYVNVFLFLRNASQLHCFYANRINFCNCDLIKDFKIDRLLQRLGRVELAECKTASLLISPQSPRFPFRRAVRKTHTWFEKR